MNFFERLCSPFRTKMSTFYDFYDKNTKIFGAWLELYGCHAHLLCSKNGHFLVTSFDFSPFYINRTTKTPIQAHLN